MKRNEFIAIYVTQKEKDRIIREADKEELDLSSWIRRAVSNYLKIREIYYKGQK